MNRTLKHSETALAFLGCHPLQNPSAELPAADLWACRGSAFRLPAVGRSIGKFLLVLFTALLITGGLFAGDAGAELPQIKQHLQEYLCNIETDKQSVPQAQSASVKSYVQSIQPDGSWKDIDYANQSRSFWLPAEHLSRTLLLARADLLARRNAESAPALREAVVRAFEYWLKKDYRCPNWWYNEIGVPRDIGRIMILIENDLSLDQIRQGIDILSRAKISMTGQNRVWLSEVVLMRALLQQDSNLVQTARDEILAAVVITTVEGLQPDFSFHQHGPQQQFGNYGLAFAGDIANWASILRGTSLAIEKGKLEILRNYLLRGEAFVMWRGVFDVSACGRQLFPRAAVQRGRSLIRIFEAMSSIDVDHAAEYEAIGELNNCKGEGTGNTPFDNKVFWRSDYLVHRRPAFCVSVKLSSQRVIGAERVNSENLLGYHLGSGATFLYRTGHEYDDIFPVWDWCRLPGVTCAQTDGKLPSLTSKTSSIDSVFVGGVSDGIYGAAAADYNRDGLIGKKGWFFFDGQMVCLGTGFATDADQRVSTSVNQCLLNGDVTVGDEKGGSKLPMGHSEHLNLRWVHHDGIGYVFPEAMKIDIRSGAQTGKWKDVFSAGSQEVIAKDVFSLGIEHGAKPQNARYSYVVLPGTSAAQVQAFAQTPEVEILSNSPNIQAVRGLRGMLTLAVFYQPGQLNYANGRNITVNEPCLMMIRNSAQETRLTIADPTQKLKEVCVSLDGKPVHIPLPQGPYAGSSTNWPKN